MQHQPYRYGAVQLDECICEVDGIRHEASTYRKLEEQNWLARMHVCPCHKEGDQPADSELNLLQLLATGVCRIEEVRLRRSVVPRLELIGREVYKV